MENSSPSEDNSAGKAKNKKKRWLLIGFPLLALGAFLLPRAWAHAGWGGRCHHSKHFSTEDVRETAGFFAGRVLGKIDATDDQRASVDALLDEMVPQWVAMRGEKQALAHKVHETLSAEVVDPEALEQLRRKAMRMAEDASNRMVHALTELSTTLSPDQRRQLLERWKSRHH